MSESINLTNLRPLTSNNFGFHGLKMDVDGKAFCLQVIFTFDRNSILCAVALYGQLLLVFTQDQNLLYLVNTRALSYSKVFNQVLCIHSTHEQLH